MEDQLKRAVHAIKVEVDKKNERELTCIELRDEGFHNFHFRLITVAALLRAIYASIKFAPTADLKYKSIKMVSDLN